MSNYDNNDLVYVADSTIHQRGCFARRNIPAGTWIGHYDGMRTLENGMHVLWIEDGVIQDRNTVDGWVGYDGTSELRFLNHAKDPNGEMDGLDLYALCDISVGEEITIDYGKEFEIADE